MLIYFYATNQHPRAKKKNGNLHSKSPLRGSESVEYFILEFISKLRNSLLLGEIMSNAMGNFCQYTYVGLIFLCSIVLVSLSPCLRKDDNYF